jgi:hypothetical protein
LQVFNYFSLIFIFNKIDNGTFSDLNISCAALPAGDENYIRTAVHMMRQNPIWQR